MGKLPTQVGNIQLKQNPSDFCASYHFFNFCNSSRCCAVGKFGKASLVQKYQQQPNPEDLQWGKLGDPGGCFDQLVLFGWLDLTKYRPYRTMKCIFWMDMWIWMDPFLFCEKKWFTPLFCNPKRFCVRGGGVIMRDPHYQITAALTCFPQAGSETFSSDFAGGHGSVKPWWCLGWLLYPKKMAGVGGGSWRVVGCQMLQPNFWFLRNPAVDQWLLSFSCCISSECFFVILLKTLRRDAGPPEWRGLNWLGSPGFVVKVASGVSQLHLKSTDRGLGEILDAGWGSWMEHDASNKNLSESHRECIQVLVNTNGDTSFQSQVGLLDCKEPMMTWLSKMNSRFEQKWFHFMRLVHFDLPFG